MSAMAAPTYMARQRGAAATAVQKNGSRRRDARDADSRTSIVKDFGRSLRGAYAKVKVQKQDGQTTHRRILSRSNAGQERS